jgi:hypothetical protein
VTDWKRWHAAFAAIAFAVPLFVYLRTMNVTVPFWDSGEFIATSYILGNPHPPGNPLYTLVGRIFSLVPIGSIAQRVNFISVLCGAFACLFTFLIVARALRRTLEDQFQTGAARLAALVGGLVAAFFLAWSTSAWNNSIEAEVYAASTAILTFAAWLGFRWWDRVGTPGNDRLLVVIMLVLGLSAGVHLGTVLVAPGILLLVGMARPSYYTSKRFWAGLLTSGLFTMYVGLAIVRGWPLPQALLLLWGGGLVFLLAWRRDLLLKNNLVTWCSLAILAGFTIQYVLLIRAQQMPAINEGAPATIEALREYLGRKQYGPASPFERRADLWYQISHMYLRYVGQQWPILEKLGSLDLQSFWVRLVNMIPFALFFLGAWWNFQRDRKTFWFFAAQHLLFGPFLIFYLNFTDHEVRERDYFFTNSYQFIAVWIGMGAAALLHAVARAFEPGGATAGPPAAVRAAATADAAPAVSAAEGAPPASRPVSPAPAAAWATAVALVGFSILPARAGWFEHDHSRFWIAHNYAYNMLAPLAPNAVVMTNGDNDTFPLWYIQEVEGFRKDVRVVNMSLLNTPWYILQLKNQEPKVPFTMSDRQIEQLYPYLDEKGEVVWVKDLAVKDMIVANQWRKPIYLAVTVPEQMGLEKQLTLEGLAYRVSPEPTRKEIDLETTIRNLYQVFRYDGLLDKNRNFDASVYKDDNAMKLVQNYSAAHVQVAYQLQTMGRIPEAIKALDDARKISPDFPGLLEYLARLYDGSGNAAKAESLYREGLARYPNSPEFYFHLGTMAYRRGNIAESIDLLRRATAMNQQYFDWFSALFTVYWQTGQSEAALEVLRGWLRAHPEDRQTAADLAVYEDSLRILGGGEPPPRPLPGER